MVRSICVLALTLSLAVLPQTCSTAVAQSKAAGKKGEPISGTVVSIEKEKTGKNYRMKIKTSPDDEELDVPLLPRTQLAVTAKGDEGFLKANVFIQTKVVKSGAGDEFFANDFTVFLGMTPQPFVKPDPSDKTVFEVSGKITMTDSTGLMVQCGPQPRKILFEAEKHVTVKISDPTLIKEGDVVEVEGTLIKSKKQLNAFTVNVTSAADINSDEYFAALEERKKPKASKAKTTKSKTDSDAGAGGDADPFGVLKKKGSKAKEDKTDSADSKKDEAKKDDAKKEEPKKDDAKKPE